MLDLSVPFYPVIMVCEEVPSLEMTVPAGTKLVFWHPGLEKDWAYLHMAAGQLGALEKGLRIFNEEFAPYPEKLRERMFFLYDEDDHPLATITLWFGSDLGYPSERLHWLSCVPQAQGRGLGKAMMQLSAGLYHKLGCTGPVYLTTQTTSYPAINIYKKYGYAPYFGPMPDNGIAWDNKEAWRIIEEKLARYRK